MPTRRDALIAAVTSMAALVASPIRAQSQKLWKVGVLTGTNTLPSGECRRTPKETPGSFLHGMDQAGFIEGRNVTYLTRCSDGDANRIPALAKELVAEEPDVILTGGFEPAFFVRRATNRIPIVMINGPDPIAQGWTNSYARPSGNVTGFTWEISETDSIQDKPFALIVEAVPGVRRIVALHSEKAEDPFLHPYNEQRKQAGKRLGVDIVLVFVPFRDFDTPFRKIRELKADALFLSGFDRGFHARQAVGEQLVRSRLPALNSGFEPFFPGAMASFAPDTRYQPGSAAGYVARILRGAKVSDLPIQRPLKTRTVVDLKVARQLGLTIPHSVLLRADEVIE